VGRRPVSNTMASQNRYWLLTIPQHLFTPYLPPNACFIRGQLEKGDNTAYLHWQVYIHFKRAIRLAAVKKTFGEGIHAEPTRSAAAEEYVTKDATAIAGTRFQLGDKPLKRNCPTDWDMVKSAAQSGDFDKIPSDIYVRCFANLKRIRADNLEPVAIQRTVFVYWGRTGAGKSRRAWEEAGLNAFPKDPRTKFWDGYKDHKHVVIDEFRGGIDISHMLRWLDRYPVIIEIKGSSTVLSAEKIWITSNIHPSEWYPDLDSETKQALLRRLNITEFL